MVQYFNEKRSESNHGASCSWRNRWLEPRKKVKSLPVFVKELSVARATSILVELERLGIQSARMAIEGYGQYSPFADNDTEAGRAENRKVVIALSKYGLRVGK